MSEFYKTNHRYAQFYKLIFNFRCLPNVSKLVCSTSGRQLHMQYGMFICIGASNLVDMWVCSSWTQSPIHQTVSITLTYPPDCLDHTQLSTILSRSHSSIYQTVSITLNYPPDCLITLTYPPDCLITLTYPPDCSHRCIWTCHTSYAAVSLKMNPRGWKQLGDTGN